jgi:hypothetical protein
MGVKQLPKILKSCKQLECSLHSLRGKFLGVDIECWFHKAIQKDSYVQSYHIDPPVPLTENLGYCLKLHSLFVSNSITPIYVNGGNKHVMKKSVDDEGQIWLIRP